MLEPSAASNETVPDSALLSGSTQSIVESVTGVARGSNAVPESTGLVERVPRIGGQCVKRGGRGVILVVLIAEEGLG